MSRDPHGLKVFALADALVLDVYRASATFPVEERFGLQSQLRRAATSVPTNIVEGCARRSTREFLKFLDVAMGSASEARYLISIAMRIGYLPAESAGELLIRYATTIKVLQGLINSVERMLRPED